MKESMRYVVPGAVILLLVVMCAAPALAASPLPSNRHIFFSVANDAGVKYNLDGAAFGGPANTYYIKADGGGLNELHITNDAGVSAGQSSQTTAQSGTFWVTNTGGRGFDDDIILLISVQDPLPDDFAVHVKSSGYDWTPNPAVNTPPAVYNYVTGAVDETFTKADFIYGGQTWKPGPGALGIPSLPLWFGQDIADPATNSYLMFVDLKVGNMYPTKFPGAALTDNGGAKVEYSFTNLDTSAAFNAYGWCLNSNQGEGISWTNKMADPGSSGVYVQGTPRTPVPEFPTFAFPVALIIGLVGTIYAIRASRED